MKKINILFLLTLFSIFIVSCSNKEEIEKLQRENDSLKNLVNVDASTLNDYLAAFNQIQENLNEIKRKENIISINTQGGEVSQSTADQIVNDIQTIYNLLQQNKQKLAQLKQKLKRSGLKNAQLRKTIELYEQQIKEKDAEIAQLKQKLEQMNIKIGELTTQVQQLNSTVDTLTQVTQQQQQTIQEQDIALHTAYYVIGTKSELKSHNIITREGFLSKLTFNTEAELSYFTKIDIRQVKEIPINSTKAQILTKHPSASYTFEKEGKIIKSLKILDPDEFWKFSKFLVILIK